MGNRSIKAVTAMAVLLVIAAGLRADDLIALEDFEGAPTVPYGLSGDGSVTGGILTGGSYRIDLLPPSLSVIYPSLSISFDVTADSSGSPFPSSATLVETSLVYTDAADVGHHVSLLPHTTPNSASTTELVGDGINSYFTGQFMLSAPEAKWVGTVTIMTHVYDSGQTITIDNFRIVGVPEPAMFVLGGAMIVVLTMRRRWRPGIG